MNSAFFRFILDVQTTRSQTSIPVSLNDTAITLYISLTDGGKPYYIEDGCLAKLSIACPSGPKIHEFCRIEGNTSVVYPFLQNPSTASEEGIHECELTLYGFNGEQLTTSHFSIIVNERVVNIDDNNGITDESIGIIDDMIHSEQQRRQGETARLEAEAIRISSEVNRTSAENERISAEAERQAFWGNKAAVYVGSGEMPEGYNVQIDTEGTSTNEFDESKLPTEIYYKVIEPEWINTIKGESYEISGIKFAETATVEPVGCQGGGQAAIEVPENTYYTIFSHTYDYSTQKYDYELPKFINNIGQGGSKVFLDDGGKRIIVSNTMTGAGCPDCEVHIHLTTYRYEDASPMPENIVLYEFSEGYDFENLQFTTEAEGNTLLGDVYTYLDEWDSRCYTIYPDYTPNIAEGQSAISLAISDPENMLYSIKLEALFNGGYTFSLGNKDFAYLGGVDVVADGDGAFASGRKMFVIGNGASGFGVLNKVRARNGTSFGYNNIVTAVNGIAFNEGNKILAYAALGLGDHNTVGGGYDIIGGLQNKSKGRANLGQGVKNIIEGEYILGLGNLNVVKGICNIMQGYRNEVDGKYNDMNGFNNKIKGNSNVVNGNYNNVNSSNNEVFGVQNTIIETSTFNVINGQNNKINAPSSVNNLIIGVGNIVEPSPYTGSKNYGYNVLVGRHNISRSSYGIAIGSNLIVDGTSSQLVLGGYNEIDRYASIIIGNGSSDTNRRNSLVIRRDGSIIQTSPNGTKYAITVNDDGTIKTKKVTN